MSQISPTILLVDDDEVDIMAIQRAFRKAALDVPIQVARDGVEALARLRGINGRKTISPPYLILLDLNMPRMNGLEFLEELRRHPEHGNTLVAVLSSSNDEKMKAAVSRYNIAGYFEKSNLKAEFAQITQLLERCKTSAPWPTSRAEAGEETRGVTHDRTSQDTDCR